MITNSSVGVSLLNHPVWPRPLVWSAADCYPDRAVRGQMEQINSKGAYFRLSLPDVVPVPTTSAQRLGITTAQSFTT